MHKHVYSVDRNILPAKITASQNEDALSYHRVRGLYFLAVVFVATLVKDFLNGGYLTNHSVAMSLFFRVDQYHGTVYYTMV